MTYNDYLDAPVYDKEGEKIGSVSDLYFTTEQDRPVWATVSSGLFGMSKHFVPLSDAVLDDDGLHIGNVTKEMVKNAPSIDGDDEETSDADDARLENYYRYQNGESADLASAEPMPNVEIAERHDSDEAKVDRVLLRRYTVTGERRKWANEDISSHETPLPKM